jgi:hypothetical protein
MSQDVIGVPNEEQALAAVATHKEDGSELSEDQRKQYAAQIEQAARGHGNWRGTLPYEQQFALMNVPTVSVPPVEDTAADSESQRAGV